MENIKESTEESNVDKLKKDMYPVRTMQELESIAQGLFNNTIFSHLQIDDSVHLAHVFVPLVYLTPEHHDFLVRYPPGLIYEYLDRAEKNVTTIWKYPLFLSCNLLTKEQATTVFEIYNTLVDKNTLSYDPDTGNIDMNDSEYIFPE